jgi:hypothetical protein
MATPIYVLFRVFDNRESYNEAELLAISDDRAKLEQAVSEAARDAGGFADLRFDRAGIRNQLEPLFEYRPRRDVFVIERWNMNDLSDLPRLVAERADLLLKVPGE